MPLRRTEYDAAGLEEIAFQARPPFAQVAIRIEPWLFGGGAVSRQNDPITPVRPPSVLGQLRFFWRLLWDGESEEALARDEAALFGSDRNAAPFRIAVTDVTRGQPMEPPPMGRPGSYLAFPARGEARGGTRAMDLIAGISATIALAASGEGLDASKRKGLLRAWDFWLLAGGVGGRTRRGLGAVQTMDWAPTSSRLALITHLRTLLASSPRGAKLGRLRSVQEVWVGEREWPDAESCLFDLERWYKDYRQDRRPGSQPNRPGRSYWDEPELIRGITGARERRHQPLPPANRHASGWARDVLGLPVVFHFKDHQDPRDTMLKGAGALDRCASALLFRPVRLGTGRYAALAVRLSCPYLPPGGLALRVGRNDVTVPATPQMERVWSELFHAGAAGRLGLRRVE